MFFSVQKRRCRPAPALPSCPHPRCRAMGAIPGYVYRLSDHLREAAKPHRRIHTTTIAESSLPASLPTSPVPCSTRAWGLARRQRALKARRRDADQALGQGGQSVSAVRGRPDTEAGQGGHDQGAGVLGPTPPPVHVPATARPLARPLASTSRRLHAEYCAELTESLMYRCRFR